jgi:hypothetical protein
VHARRRVVPTLASFFLMLRFLPALRAGGGRHSPFLEIQPNRESIMKKITFIVLAALLSAAIAPSSHATDVPQPGRIVLDPVTPVYGTFEATLRMSNYHRDDSGYYTNDNYYYITASTMDSCQAQLGSMLTNGNIQVVTWCIQTS